MNNRIIYFIGTLALLMAATLAVHAQDQVALDVALNETMSNETTLNVTLNETILDNATMNNTALADLALDTATLNASVNEMQLENATIETDVDSGIAPDTLSDSSATIPPTADDEGVFKLGSGPDSGKLFVINANAEPKDTFEVGIPIKPPRDVGKMVFVCDII